MLWMLASCFQMQTWKKFPGFSSHFLIRIITSQIWQNDLKVIAKGVLVWITDDNVKVAATEYIFKYPAQTLGRNTNFIDRFVATEHERNNFNVVKCHRGL